MVTVSAPATRNWLITKSSIERAKAMANDEINAGVSNGSSTLVTACHGEAPRSIAASS